MDAAERAARARWARPIVRVLASADILAGLAYLLGPARWTSGGNFALLRALPVPIQVWAAAFVVAGVLMLTVREWWGGYLLGAVSLTAWALLQALTLGSTATGGAGPVWVGALAAQHYIGMWRRAAAASPRHEGGDGG